MSKIHIEPKWSEVKPSDCYVYLHFRMDDELCFHVGKGSKSRGWDTWSRSSWWIRVAQKHGCRVEIYKSGMSEVCSLTLEKILIAKYRALGHPLTNLTDGGEGVVGCVMPFRKPVVNSLGDRYDSVMNAAEDMRSRGEYKASSGDISSAAMGKTESACGCAWWYEGEEPKEYISRWIRQAVTTGKAVVSSDGMEFETLTYAANYLKDNGYPKAKAYNISLAARGDIRYAYGSSWEYKEKTMED